MLSRRGILLTGTALSFSLTGLAACTTTTTGNVTTTTLNVALVDKYAEGIQTLGDDLLGNATVASALGANAAAAQTALDAFAVDIHDFLTTAGTATTVSLDTTDVKTAVTSLLSDAGKLLGYIKGLPGLSPTLVTEISAAETLVATLQTMAGFLSVSYKATPRMTPEQALAIADKLK